MQIPSPLYTCVPVSIHAVWRHEVGCFFILHKWKTLHQTMAEAFAQVVTQGQVLGSSFPVRL